ncbi:MAG TPA: hypothetical protein VFI99_16565 [Nocardioides sp.]|jgi:hypothetical protein|nr:hypothetical protein [Nocardioides sp.]
MNGECFLDAVNISKVDADTGSTNSGTAFDLEPTASARRARPTSRRRSPALTTAPRPTR